MQNSDLGKRRIKRTISATETKSKVRMEGIYESAGNDEGGPPPKSPEPVSEMLVNVLPDEFKSAQNPYDEDFPEK